MKYVVFIAAVVTPILLFLLISASANTSLLASHYPALLALNGVAAAALIVLVSAQLRKLWHEYREGVFGSRLKSRLIWMLALMAILPGALLYGVSMQFAVSSIDSWFDVRVDSALESGLELGRGVLKAQQAELADKARVMAVNLGYDATTPANLGRLLRLREQAGVQSASLLSPGGSPLVTSSAANAPLTPQLPSPGQLRKAQREQGMTWVEGDAQSGLVLQALMPVAGGDLVPPMLLLTQPVPQDLARSADLIESAYRDYQELQIGKTGLKRIYTLTLTLTLLLALFAAIALAFFLARRLAEPLLILVEGTRAVAAGDFTPKTVLETSDELGLLTQSFSFMTRQLGDARHETERHRDALEKARAYLESVLANLSAGVLAFNDSFMLRAANVGAASILGEGFDGLDKMPLDQWPRHSELARIIQTGFRDNGQEWQLELPIQAADGITKTLLVRGSTMPRTGGYVVVFDDISGLIAAQRAAAWGEVARRLAHEIKNPLTPIQLSAERLQHKLAPRLDQEARQTLERSTQTIINQVEAMKNMVNDFRDYARTPPPSLASVDLNALIEEMLGLYESAHSVLKLDLSASLPRIQADANQLRQVLHNLLANAEDALAESETPCVSLSTRSDGRRVTLCVTDNGSGFAPQTLTRAFEPYVTTKPKGTGLGLAIVKKIIDEHHGEIRLANRPDGGAEVTIRLPVVEPLSAAA